MSDPNPGSVYPSLSYDDAPAAIAWLGEAFGFEPRLVVPGPDDSVMHSELTLGDAVVMVGTSRPAEGRLSPRGLPGVTMSLSIYVADPDAHHDRAVAAGAEITRPLQDEDYGARGYTVKDCEGHSWYFANYRPGAWWDGKGQEPSS